MVSIVIPIYNEEANILPMMENIADVLTKMDQQGEVILVDDGSRDDSKLRISQAVAIYPFCRGIFLRFNSGQTAAIMAGIEYALGDIIISMDGDQQNDPRDIPKLLAKLDEGYDVVSGWRFDRQDKLITRKNPSYAANRIISWISGVQLHDYGCTLKAYRADVIKGVRLYGEMHRFIPIYAYWMGAGVTELKVNHHPRIHGETKYGLSRIIKVVLDIIVVKYLDKYFTKPMHLFGSFGLAWLLFSLVLGGYAFYRKFMWGTSLINTPLPSTALVCLMLGVISILMGLLAETLSRTFFEAQGKRSYIVRKEIAHHDGKEREVIPGDNINQQSP